MRLNERTDWVFLVTLALLIILGLLSVYSASGTQKNLFTHQLLYFL